MTFLTKSKLKELSKSQYGFTCFSNEVFSSIISSDELSSTEKLLMIYFIRNSYLGRGDEVEISKSIKTISTEMSKSTGTISETINSLENKGWIVQENTVFRSKTKKIVLEKLVSSSTQEGKNNSELGDIELKAENSSLTSNRKETPQPPSPTSFSKINELNLKLSMMIPGSEEYESCIEEINSLKHKSTNVSQKVSPPCPSLPEFDRPPISTGLLKIIQEKVLLLKSSGVSLSTSEILGHYLYSLTKGSFRFSNKLKGIRAITKLFLSGKWRTPKGYEPLSSEAFSSLNLSFN